MFYIVIFTRYSPKISTGEAASALATLRLECGHLNEASQEQQLRVVQLNKGKGRWHSMSVQDERDLSDIVEGTAYMLPISGHGQRNLCKN
jgi:hypothetical protein